MTPISADPYALVVELGAVLDALGVPYYLGGGLASTLHGEWRTTHDIDLVADLQLDDVPRLLGALGPAWDVDEPALQEAVRLRASMNLFHLTPFMLVDLYLAKPEAFQRSVLARRIRLQAPAGGELWICSQEDLVLQKLRWYRLGGEVSERQWKDVRGVLRAWWGRLDADYLSRWAQDLGISDLLDAALAEAAEPS